MYAYSPAEWSDLFVAAAGASAALTGLVFVAVSINIDRILNLSGLPERALATLLLLLWVTVVSILGLVPGQSDTALGIELLAVSLAFLVTVTLLIQVSLRQASAEVHQLTTRFLALSPGVLLVVGAASILIGSGGGFYWILAGMLGAIVGAVMNAWVLLVEILR